MSIHSTTSEFKQSQGEPFWRLCTFLVIALFIAALYPVSRINYLLFHNLVELSSVTVSITLFSIGWNSRHITRNDAFLFLAIAFLPVAGLDLLHTLSYKGSGVFPNAGVDPPTQFWIAARFVEAVSYRIASLLIGQAGRLKPWRTLGLFGLVGALLTLSIWPLKIFPVCLVESSGLTTFKVASEYIICVLLIISGLFFWRARAKFDPRLLKILLLSIGLTILSEVAFTLYTDVYGISNVLGHFLKLASIFMIYRALVLGSLQTPYHLLFRELDESHQALDTELKYRSIIEKQLRQANQELESFIHTVSHDLRLPLTSITGFSELLQSELKDQLSKSHQELLGRIENQGHRMSGMLNDLLSLAQVGRLETEPQLVDLSSVAKQVVGDLSQEIMTNDCRIEVEDMPEIQAHPSLIYQVFANLISNAVRYGSNQEKPIVVGANKQGHFYRLFVKDHGAGIPVEEQERIFTLFYRKNDKQSHGTGIGLAIVQKIARFYSGKTYVEDTPGGGATFCLEFPEYRD